MKDDVMEAEMLRGGHSQVVMEVEAILPASGLEVTGVGGERKIGISNS